VDLGPGLAIVVAIVIVIFVGAFLYELGRRFYYWAAAKVLGWSEHEKFDREIAWIDRAVARDRHLAERDSIAAGNTERRRYGVSLITFAVAALAFQSLPWWQAALVTAAVYAGTTMAAGLAWKWW
jgi:hypothetical protein